MRVHACTHTRVPLYIHTRTLSSSRTRGAFFTPTSILPHKTAKMLLLKINELQRKCKKNAFRFGQFKKKQYLCIRFRPKI